MKSFFVSVLTTSICMIANAGQSGQFAPVYKDSINKLSWSKMLPGDYSNGSVGANGRLDDSKNTFEKGPDGNLRVKVEDSNAAKACRNVGGRLPTTSEYESLVRNFDHFEARFGPEFTDKGIRDMRAVFGETAGHWAWTSSVPRDSGMLINVPDNSVDGVSAYIQRETGSFDRMPRFHELSVRCVADR